MLISIVNHNHNRQALALADRMRPFGHVITIDSGSTLTAEEQAHFDIQLPNVYYSGCLNAAWETLTAQPDSEELLFICSDVEIDDCERLILRAKHAFEDRLVGVYAPSVNRSGHPQMLARNGGNLRPVVFVEGIAFAVRQSLLEALCPIDTQKNKLGWGLDVYLGYLTLKAGLKSVVDDQITILHDGTSGYDTVQAREQYNRWYAEHCAPAQRFRKLVSFRPMKSRLGLEIAKRMIK
ncbi:MAG: hypothetical protein AAGD96_19305 [Chloroflexota bacterium]